MSDGSKKNLEKPIVLLVTLWHPTTKTVLIYLQVSKDNLLLFSLKAN
jgi:hypothetical protein